MTLFRGLNTLKGYIFTQFWLEKIVPKKGFFGNLMQVSKKYWHYLGVTVFELFMKNFQSLIKKRNPPLFDISGLELWFHKLQPKQIFSQSFIVPLISFLLLHCFMLLYILFFATIFFLLFL